MDERVSRIKLFSLGAAMLLPPTLNACWVAAAGAGAEAAYVLTQEDRSASETVTDQRITAAVKTKLLTDSRVAGLDINVDTFKSRVTLRGAVRTAREADAAVALAEKVSGVQSVTSKLAVTP